MLLETPSAVNPEILVKKSLSVVEKLHFVQWDIFRATWYVVRITMLLWRLSMCVLLSEVMLFVMLIIYVRHVLRMTDEAQTAISSNYNRFN